MHPAPCGFDCGLFGTSDFREGRSDRSAIHRRLIDHSYSFSFCGSTVDCALCFVALSCAFPDCNVPWARVFTLVMITAFTCFSFCVLLNKFSPSPGSAEVLPESVARAHYAILKAQLASSCIAFCFHACIFLLARGSADRAAT